MGDTIDRVKLITEVLKDHRLQHGIRDLNIHCLCGWSAPRHTGRHMDHLARHIEAALFPAAIESADLSAWYASMDDDTAAGSVGAGEDANNERGTQ